MVKSVSSGRGFVNDAMVVQWDPFGEIVQTEVDGWNVVEIPDIDFTEEFDDLSKILPKHKRVGSRRTSERKDEKKTKTKTTKTPKSGGRKRENSLQEEEEEKEQRRTPSTATPGF